MSTDTIKVIEQIFIGILKSHVKPQSVSQAFHSALVVLHETKAEYGGYQFSKTDMQLLVDHLEEMKQALKRYC